MALHVHELFEHLNLPFTDGAVVGDTYYATPVPGSPLRLRISLSAAVRVDEYDGLRLQVVHPDLDRLDTAVLSFADHGTFHHRDAELERRPGQSGYAKIQDVRTRPDWNPWDRARTGALRTAIERYTAVWFPGAWTTGAARTAGRTAHTAPVAPLTRSNARAR